MRTFFRALLLFTLLLFTALWLSSYSHHTAIGIDHDQLVDNHTIKWFHRITWNGHGSLWVGYGTTAKRPHNPKQTLERYDPASVFFQPARPITTSQSFWNRLGFWFISATEPRKTFWIGVPSWLPVLLLALLIFQLRRKRAA